MPESPEVALSILIPCYNEAQFIGPCLDSLLAQDYDLNAAEVLVIDGGSNDGTREIIQTYADKYGFIRLLHNPARTVPHALNQGITHSFGEVIMRMDVHCEFPSNYVSGLLQWQQQLGADNVGAVLETKAADTSPRATAIATACSHPFGVGNSHFRIGSAEVKQVDTVPFGCYRRSVFERIGLFDEELIRNQDDEFNGRLLREGGSIFLIPHISATYFPRSTLGSLLAMYYQYGKYKPLVAKKLGAPVTVRQLVPAALVLFLIGSGISGVFLPQILPIFFAVFLLYELTAFGLAISNTLSKGHGFAYCLNLFAAFNCLHLSYGWGYLSGITHLVAGKAIANSEISR